MSRDREKDDPQLARIALLLKAARLEVESLRPGDDELRRAICGDLDDMLKTLRASVQAVCNTHPSDPDASPARESNGQPTSSDGAEDPPHQA